MATWQLVTGVTGLLGQHLLIQSLRRRIPTAVIARSKPGSSADERIDWMISACESRLGMQLERPIVLEGELTKTGLGLTSDDLEWCRRNIRSVVHCAASVKFQATKYGEPTKTNVEGTARILELFATSSLREFHYVSTAYACGHVSDGRTVAETLHPLTTSFRNIYEDSKCKAEHLVMSAPGEFERSIYRPSIIVGHSSNGYSPSFNALYKPMQLIWMLIKEFPFALRHSTEWLDQFGIGAEDSRNVVPVDWVSEALIELIHRTDSEGRIFHLTNPTPVLNREIVSAMVKVLKQHFQEAAYENSANAVFLESLDSLNDQLDVYRSYFSVDPVFDTTNVSRVTSCPACPKLGVDDLVKMFSFAVQSEFKNEDFRAEKRSGSQPYELFRRLATDSIARGVGNQANGSSHASTSQEIKSSVATEGTSSFPRVRLVISGSGGGSWELRLEEGRVVCDRPNDVGVGEILIYTSAHVFRDWLRGTTSVDHAIKSGAIVLMGPGLEFDFIRLLLLAFREQISRLTDISGNLECNGSDELRAELVTGGVRNDV